MQLTKHFTLEEMLRSDTAVRLDIKEQFTPPPEVVDNLTALCKNVLEPLRALLPEPSSSIHISSGYRCLRLNNAIGGAANSQHIKGQAADTHVPGMAIEDWYRFIKNSGIEFDELIQEFDSWVHISYTAKGNRCKCLHAIKENGKTAYIEDKL